MSPTTALTGRRIDHVAVAVEDADRAAQWYVDALGFEVVGDEVVQSANVRLVYVAPPNVDETATVVQLAQPLGPGRVMSHLQTTGEGLHHVCFAVDDIRGFVTAQNQPESDIFVAGRARLACFLSEKPAGVLVEITETERSIRP